MNEVAEFYRKYLLQLLPEQRFSLILCFFTSLSIIVQTVNNVNNVGLKGQEGQKGHEGQEVVSVDRK